jgi:phage-related minor tail protein
MVMEHTPGPWHLTGSLKFIMAPNSAGGYSIARMDDFEAPYAARIANAILIAAAPEMLAALIALVAADGGDDPEIVVARAAIARATGETT